MAGRNLGRHSRAQARRDAKQHLALAQAEIAEEELYHPPAEADCDVDPSELYLDPDNRLHVTLYWCDGRLVRFFMAWQSREHVGEWSERYSVCTKHGMLHEHTTGHQEPNDSRHVLSLYSQADVQDCHDRAYDMVHSRYQFASGGGTRD